MRMGSAFRNGVMRIAEPRNDRLGTVAFAALAGASMSASSAVGSAVMLVGTFGLWSEAHGALHSIDGFATGGADDSGDN